MTELVSPLAAPRVRNPIERTHPPCDPCGSLVRCESGEQIVAIPRPGARDLDGERTVHINPFGIVAVTARKRV